jgi:hypothetical protein
LIDIQVGQLAPPGCLGDRGRAYGTQGRLKVVICGGGGVRHGVSPYRVSEWAGLSFLSADFLANHSAISSSSHPTEFPPNEIRLGNLSSRSIRQIVASDRPILLNSSGFLIILWIMIFTSINVKKNAHQVCSLISNVVE